jgi:hypothetical protein
MHMAHKTSSHMKQQTELRLFYSDQLKFLLEQSDDFPLETSFPDAGGERCPDARIVQSL